MTKRKKKLSLSYASDVQVSSSTSEEKEEEDIEPTPKPIEVKQQPEERLSLADPGNTLQLSRGLSLLDEDDAEDSDEDPNLDEVGSYINQKVLMDLPDFFDELGEVPDISEVSMDMSEEEEELPPAEEISDPNLDKGTFVDPLSGGQLSSSESEELLKAPVIVEEEEEPETSSSADLTILPLDADDEPVVGQTLFEDEVFEKLMEIDAEKKIIHDEGPDPEELMRQEEARAFAASIENYLYSLFDQIVELAEYIDPKTILRANLDKHKLYIQLRKTLRELNEEQYARAFLNRKVVEHFRRKKSFRPISDDNPDTLANDMQRYREAMEHLDSALGREDHCKTYTVSRMNELSYKAAEAERKSFEELANFETMIKKALLRDTFEKLPGSIDHQLRHMARLRNEISQVRFVLIQRLHTVAMLSARMEKLENIGEGLRMNDFEHLQTETQALDKKLEERNAELNKFRYRCNADIHIMAHMREKQVMLKLNIGIQKQALSELEEEKQFFRRIIYRLKLDRTRIKREIDELSFQGGLISKPTLMLDFDETVKNVAEKRKTNDLLRWRYRAGMRRVNALENQLKEQNV